MFESSLWTAIFISGIRCIIWQIASAIAGGVFVLNNFLTYIFELPGLYGFLNVLGADFDFPKKDYSTFILILGFFQSLMYVGALIWPAYIIFNLKDKPRNSKGMNLAAELIVSACLLVGNACWHCRCSYFICSNREFTAFNSW